MKKLLTLVLFSATVAFAQFLPPGTTVQLVPITPETGANSVTSVTGTANQITASPTVGDVILSTPSTFIAPGTIASTTTIKAGTTFNGLNGQTITGNSAGAWAVATNGTNQSITLTPSGTGVVTNSSMFNAQSVAFPGFPSGTGLLFGFDSGSGGRAFLTSYTGGNTGKPMFFDATTHAFGIVGTTKVTIAGTTGNLLLGGLTTDGTGVAQFPVHTTTAGGISLGTAAFLYTQVSGGRGINVSGTGTNDSAPAGYYGEFTNSLVAVGSAVSLSSNTAANMTSISLTAGDWDVEGNVNFALTGATTTAFQAGISSTSATLPTDGSEIYSAIVTTVLTDTETLTCPRKRISVSGTTTVYIVAKSTFSVGTEAVFGALTARRVR